MTPDLDTGLDLPAIAAHHAAALFDRWASTALSPEDLAAAVQATFDADVAALAHLLGATREIDRIVLRQAYAFWFAGAWGDLQAGRVVH